MSLHIGRMQPNDYYQLGKEVKETYSRNANMALPNSLVSADIFGDNRETVDLDRSVASDHLRGYIKLCKTVLNPLIAGKNASYLARILGYDKNGKEMLRSVLDARSCYDIKNDKLVPIDNETMKRSQDYLWGAEYLRKLVDDFDIEQAIIRSLSGLIPEYKKMYGGVSGQGKFVRGGKEGYIVVGDWRFVPSDDCTYERFPDVVIEKRFTSADSQLSYLINLQGHKDRLYSMFMDHIAVLPINMRPDTDIRHHSPITVAYADVITANQDLALMISGMFDANLFATKYRRLEDAVNRLLDESEENNKNQRSILEKVESKEGHIRKYMLGRNVDYSGRSVITIDPFLSIRDIRIPKDMAPKLFRHHLFKDMSNPEPSDWVGQHRTQKCNDRLVSRGILDKVPVVIGRQPTLHKPSMRSFHAELSDERSIRINPLCVVGFNADFDGDQMWIRVPVGEEAVSEANNLMSIAQNIYFPKTGECAIMPRQEILYGLNVCTRANLQKGSVLKNYADADALFEDLFMQEIAVSDTVSWNGYTDCAGRVAFATCLTQDAFHKFGITEITKRTIEPYVEYMLDQDVEVGLDMVDRMVLLGFKISYLYPPTLNLLDENEVSFESEFGAFHQATEEIQEYYDRGLEEESMFNLQYDAAFGEMEKKITDGIYDRLGEESGFVRLAASGARGSKSNLQQMYAYKGRIQKSAQESFRAVIESSFTDQLSPLEHFVTAYGGRQGLINKSLNTADTGYTMRKMWHTTSPYVITCDDCGTTEGIRIAKYDILGYAADEKEVPATFQHIITGRIEAKTNRYISKEIAEKLANDPLCEDIVIRSPITCKNPCCKRCYGDDPSTHRTPAIGLPIGFIAAQSIGEPGTQLSMDSFKKGGVASKGSEASAFDRLEAYTECTKLYQNPKFPSYDPIAWTSGQTVKRYKPDGTMSVLIDGPEGSRKSVTLPGNALIKEEVEKGEGLFVEPGDFDLHELIKYKGIRDAQMYLVYTLYYIYKNECLINACHFEVLAAAMTMHMVVSTDRDDLYVGQYHDSIQMAQGSLDNTIYTSTLISVKMVQTYRPQFMSRMSMERIKSGLASSVLLGLSDPLDYPINRILMGLPINFGGTGDYMNERMI